MRCFGVQYRCIFLLFLCILTRRAGSSKYCRTRKNIHRYCKPKHQIRYIYCSRFKVTFQSAFAKFVFGILNYINQNLNIPWELAKTTSQVAY